MGCKWIMRYVRIKKLHKEVSLMEIADEHRRKTGQVPVIAVDGPRCVWYLYENCDFCCGGQYKEFREACKNFVRQFRNCGVRLVFFFHGLRPAEKYEKWVQMAKDNVGKINQGLQNLHLGGGKALDRVRLPEGLVPCARVIFRDEPSTEVRLCMGDYNGETAEYAASCENCLGVMSSNGNFLVYKNIPNLFTFDRRLQLNNGVRMLCFCPSDIASEIGVEREDMPAFATFLGNDTIETDELENVHKRLGCSYENLQELVCAVAKLVKGKTIEEMCQSAFGGRWRELFESVLAGIGQYDYKPKVSEAAAVKGSRWSEVLRSIEAKHRSGEIPAVILSVALHRTFRLGEVLEDLAHAKYSSMTTAEVLQPMRHRMYTVLLWESGDGPFRVEEQMTSSTDRYQLQVDVDKRLPRSVVHPGLLKLWTGDPETRWRLFSWVVGTPDPDGSTLRSLEPQCLVVPAVALHFLRHEANLLSRHEAEVFAVVAVTVGTLTAEQLSKKRILTPDPRAIYLSTLFVRTALHVLDVAAVCGLFFPREADCQLDAYFDGKFFHELYLKAKAQSFARVGIDAPWDPTYLDPIHKFLDVIEGSHTDRQ
ncbi:constitutive coactivator of peroxisome proliferator-activated receptor gamma-like [Schistocerca nitens]|uniref:constitutive coactivator of peroxisome proliferator-activated receptor gamma-like n=1 Tax=Schistocerca nitens TaxID=7011 RepID=UPI00211792FE|nr:constitutive coactivator of peroxisome proliferator-activated receptor gamma-like [Schistocerca nitens]